MWHNYSKNKPPKHVIIIADFGDYQEKLIWTGKKLWSEESQNFINDEPQSWKIQSTSNS